MERKIVEFTYDWAKKLNVDIQKITFRKYRRGVAYAFPSRGEIRYNFRISQMLTRQGQNLVALHEVAHLITPRVHSKEWKALMDKHWPNWRKITKGMYTKKKRTKTLFRIKTEARLRKMKKDSVKRLLRNPKTSTHVKHIAKEILSEKK